MAKPLLFRNTSLSVLLLISLKLVAQKPMLQQQFSFQKKEYSLNDLAKIIKLQADCNVAFNASAINGKTKIVLPKLSMNWKEIALLLNSEKGIACHFIGRSVILKLDETKMVKPKQKRSIAKKTRKGKASQPLKVKAKSSSSSLAGTDVPNKVPQTTIVNADTTVYFTDTFSLNSSSLNAYGIAIGPDAAALHWEHPFDRLDKPEVVDISPQWYERFGLMASLHTEEHFFLNPGISIRWANIILSGQYAIHTSQSHMRWQAAYEFPLSKTVNIGVSASWGRLPGKSSQFTYVADSVVGTPDSSFVIPVNKSDHFELSGSLIKYQVYGSWQLSQRFDLFAGLSFNHLRTEISYRNTQDAPSVFLPPEAVYNNSSFDLLRPSMLLRDEFSFQSTVFLRQWIGFQVGFRWHLLRAEKKY